MAKAVPPKPSAATDLRGLNQLTIEAITGTTDLVEAVHASVVGLPGILRRSPSPSTRGVAGLVYRSVRGVARLVGGGVDFGLARLSPLLGAGVDPVRRDAALAALNGVLGDHLAASANPLAIAMRLRVDAEPLLLRRGALAARLPDARARILVMAHGLCMNDRQWRFRGHDHGVALAKELDRSLVHLHYNSGRHVSENGRDFAHLLERLVAEWPVDVESIDIVGHSMGGLVARSACQVAADNSQLWLRTLDKLVFLGTPHHGAPLERAGSWVDMLIGLSPYTAPFARLGKLRSAGIQDLRHGNVRQEDWRDLAGHTRDDRTPSPLPQGVRCYAIATTAGAARQDRKRDGTRTDGLVTVDSALGRHPDRAFDLRLPASRRWTGHGINHIQMLGDATVYRKLLRWLAA